MNKLVALSIGL